MPAIAAKIVGDAQIERRRRRRAWRMITGISRRSKYLCALGGWRWRACDIVAGQAEGGSKRQAAQLRMRRDSEMRAPARNAAQRRRQWRRRRRLQAADKWRRRRLLSLLTLAREMNSDNAAATTNNRRGGIMAHSWYLDGCDGESVRNAWLIAKHGWRALRALENSGVKAEISVVNIAQMKHRA